MGTIGTPEGLSLPLWLARPLSLLLLFFLPLSLSLQSLCRLPLQGLTEIASSAQVQQTLEKIQGKVVSGLDLGKLDKAGSALGALGKGTSGGGLGGNPVPSKVFEELMIELAQIRKANTQLKSMIDKGNISTPAPILTNAYHGGMTPGRTGSGGGTTPGRAGGATPGRQVRLVSIRREAERHIDGCPPHN